MNYPEKSKKSDETFMIESRRKMNNLEHVIDQLRAQIVNCNSEKTKMENFFNEKYSNQISSLNQKISHLQKEIELKTELIESLQKRYRDLVNEHNSEIEILTMSKKRNHESIELKESVVGELQGELKFRFLVNNKDFNFYVYLTMG